MSDACTIYGSKVDYTAIYDIVSRTSPAPAQVTGNVDNWQTIKLVRRASLTINSMKRRPGTFDDFSQLILGTYAFFQHIDGPPEVIKRRERILETVSNCQFALGVIASPQFSETDKHFEVILAVTSALDGLIFNGSGMVDKNGRIVLDNDGDFDAE